MWLLYNQAKTFQQLPSDLLGFEQVWVSWMFNNAVFYLGRHADNKLSQRDDKGKSKYTIEQALNLPPQPVSMAALLNRSGVRVRTIPSSQKKED